MYEKHKGKIPEGMLACHKCDNPLCINPDHLFIGTNLDNMMDKVRKNRQSKLMGEKSATAKMTELNIKEIRLCQDDNKAIASRFGISKSQVSKIKTGMAWSHLQANILEKGISKRGEKHHNVKLTEKSVREIRGINNLRQWEIAKLYGVSQQTVSEIKTMKKWKYLKEDLACQ